jgi:hypothetical protein
MNIPNAWDYVIAAYALVIGGAGGLTAWAWLAMRKAEKDAQR